MDNYDSFDEVRERNCCYRIAIVLVVELIFFHRPFISNFETSLKTR